MRLVVGITATLQGAACAGNADDPTAARWIAAALAAASGLSVLIGLFTPAAAAIAGVMIAGIALRFPIDTASLYLDRSGALCVAAVAAALVMLGPGALSLDARLFGRREIIFPHHPRTSAPGASRQR